MAVNAIAALHTNGRSVLTWEPSWGHLSAPSITFSQGLILQGLSRGAQSNVTNRRKVRFRCQVFYVDVGVLMRPESRTVTLKLNRLFWRNLCFQSLCSGSFLELFLCTQTWPPAPRGAGRSLPSNDKPAVKGQSSRLGIAAVGWAAAARSPWLLRSVRWEAKLRLLGLF